MATGTTVNSDMVIYDRTAQTSYLERIQDRIQLFNAASNGALVLRNESIEGDFDKEAIYTLETEVAHRNVNSVSSQDDEKFGSDEIIAVKCPWKMPPVASTEESFKRRNRSVTEQAMLYGQQLADSVLAYQVSAAISALAGAIEGNASMTVSGSWSTDGKKVLTKALRPFGDASERLILWGMHSADYFDLVDQAITDKLFGEIGITVYGGQPGTLGRPVLVSDKFTEGEIYGLQRGAVDVVESQPPGLISERVSGFENIIIRSQAEGAFNVGVLGYKFAGSANPNNTALATPSNWSQYAVSDKATAGVQLTVSS